MQGPPDRAAPDRAAPDRAAPDRAAPDRAATVRERAAGWPSTQTAELERLGFRIVSASDDTLVATRTRFHWDCLLTFVSYHVVVRRVALLTGASLVADRKAHMREARKHDRNLLPRGVQKGRVLVLVYIADRCTGEARALCESPSRPHVAAMFWPAVLDLNAQHAWYFRDLRLWGAAYVPKLRYLVQRLIEPQLEPAPGIPLSRSGIALGLCCLLLLAIALARLPAAFGWRLLPVFAHKVSGLAAATDVVAGGSGFCASQPDAVACWNTADSSRLTTITGLQRPRKLAMHGTDACALDDAGVQCWRLDKPAAALVDGTTGATELIATDSNYCALVSEQVRCWREAGWAPENMIGLRRPRRLLASLSRTSFCAVDDAGLKCFRYYATDGSPFYQPGFWATGFGDVLAVSAQETQSRLVVLDEGRLLSYSDPTLAIAATGPVRRKNRFDPPVGLRAMTGFRNPRALVEDSLFTWALDDEGIKRVEPGGKQEETELVLPGGTRTRNDRGGVGNATLLAGPVSPTAVWSGPPGFAYSREPAEGGLLRASGTRRGKPSTYVIHGVRDPKKVVRSSGQACALDASGVTCWKEDG